MHKQIALQLRLDCFASSVAAVFEVEILKQFR